MRQNHHAPQRRNATRLGLLLVSALALLLLASAAARGPAASTPETTPGATATEPAAQVLPKPWTALGSTGAVDEGSLNLYATVSSEMGFKTGVAGNILIARYNVTNTFDNNANPNRPGWRTLEMGSVAPTNVIIEAKLFQVRACQTAQVLLCTARNRSNDFPCARCDLSATPVDFTNNLYYVEVTIDRTGAPAALPRVVTLRLLGGRRYFSRRSTDARLQQRRAARRLPAARRLLRLLLT